MNYYLTLALCLFVYMSLWFIISLIKKRNDIADIAWGIGFVLLSWVSFYLSEMNGLRGFLVSLLVTIWGTRLALHIYLRNRGKSEDYRYHQWRMDWGKWFFLRSYFQVYLLQGLLLFLIAMPVLLINDNSGSPIGIIDVIGVALWFFGFYFEMKGDAELSRFIKDPSNNGKLLTSGLWSYSRHPNYFGEVTQWWGIWIIALAVPNGFFSLIGPLTITFLILKVSGVPMLEKRMEQNPEFAEYKKTTSMFIPLPKRDRSRK